MLHQGEVDEDDGVEAFAGADGIVGRLPVGLHRDAHAVGDVAIGNSNQALPEFWRDNLIGIQYEGPLMASVTGGIKGGSPMRRFVFPVSEEHLASTLARDLGA
ncbi:MAG: hypothetical protein ACOYON_15950, partial [Fimbriimonas sp.]